MCALLIFFLVNSDTLNTQSSLQSRTD